MKFRSQYLLGFPGLARIANGVELSQYLNQCFRPLDIPPLSSMKGCLEPGIAVSAVSIRRSFEDDWPARRSGYGRTGCPPGVGAASLVLLLHSYQISTS